MCQFPHNKASTAYVKGCRCERCVEDHRSYHSKYARDNAIWRKYAYPESRRASRARRYEKRVASGICTRCAGPRGFSRSTINCDECEDIRSISNADRTIEKLSEQLADIRQS